MNMNEAEERRLLLRLIKKRYKDDGENITVRCKVYEKGELLITHIRSMSDIDRQCMMATILMRDDLTPMTDSMPLSHSSTDLLFDMFDALLSDRSKVYTRVVKIKT